MVCCRPTEVSSTLSARLAMSRLVPLRPSGLCESSSVRRVRLSCCTACAMTAAATPSRLLCCTSRLVSVLLALSIAPRARPPLGPAPFQPSLSVCRLLALVCSASASASTPAARRRFQLRSSSVKADSARAAASGAAVRAPRLFPARCSVRSAGGRLATAPLLGVPPAGAESRECTLLGAALTRVHSAPRTTLLSPSRLPPILSVRNVRRRPSSSAAAASTLAPAAGPIWLLVRSSSVSRALLRRAAASSAPPCAVARGGVVRWAVVRAQRW